jgi:pimeloyl-ACP methyl ester carboxylesterase
MQRILTLLLALTLAPAGAWASDLEKEARWRAQVEDALMDGEVVDLKVGDHDVFALYTPAGDAQGRAAVVVHGIGVHPDWPQVVYPLRTRLPAAGWSTLSVQMPILPNEAESKDYAPLFDEVAPRLDAAVAYLKGQGYSDIVIVAHSLGASMASYYLAQHPQAAAGLVAIGVSGGAADPRMNSLETLKGLKVPTLDLYGQNDLEAVVATHAERAAAAAGNPGYSQAQVPGADHFFDGEEDALVETVSAWLTARP